MLAKGKQVLLPIRHTDYLSFFHVVFTYTAVDEVKKLLVAAGYKELKEIDHWNIKPSDKVCMYILE